MAIEVTRTYVGSIQNHRQVCDGLDSLGDSASKIWNVARWTADRIWDATGEIPDEGVLKAYMKNQSCWKDLNAQSSQKVIEELSDAFQSWFDLRHKNDEANPPGYRKHGDTRPKSTVTFKANGFKHDPENNRVRLSKGSNLKESWSDFILCEYQTRPDVDLSEVTTVQNVRAVWNGEEWELHFVCKVELKTNDPAGDDVAGIDLGITNIATVAFPDEYVLYPGNSLKEDKHYFTRTEYDTEGENGPSEKSMWARRKLANRETHFYHALTDTIITECVERGLYVCSSCELVANADCNGAENMRQKITPSPHGEDRSNGCVAQPSVHLFDRESGTFNTRGQVVS